MTGTQLVSVPLPESSYAVLIHSPASADEKARWTTVTVGSGESQLTVRARPRPPLAAGAQVFEGAVHPPGPAEIELMEARTGDEYRATAGADGRFRATGLIEGAYVIIARRPDGATGVAYPNRTRLDGALVLVGTRLLDDHDYFYPPVDVSQGGLLYGVEVHGYAIDNLLENGGVEDAALMTAAGRVHPFAVVATLGVSLAGSLAMAVFTLFWGVLAWLTVSLGYLWVAYRALAERGIWIDIALPIGSLFAGLVWHTAHHYRAERTKSERRKAIFGRFVNPEMVHRILELDDVVLEGERSRITVLFSDIRGFTSISEGMDPKALLEFLNEYFSLMGPILKKHDGTHDKYIGDAIMGFFGAPIACEDHALQAVSAAVEMLELNQRMRAERPDWFDIGFGIHTGEAVTGFLGSRDGAVSYSAIGDTVNLASRLEGLNKEYRSHILISEATRAALGDRFELRPIEGEVKVKGKKEGVQIYEVLGRKGQPRIAPPLAEAH